MVAVTCSVLVTLLPKLNKSITMKSVYSGFAYFMLALAACFAIFGFLIFVKEFLL